MGLLPGRALVGANLQSRSSQGTALVAPPGAGPAGPRRPAPRREPRRGAGSPYVPFGRYETAYEADGGGGPTRPGGRRLRTAGKQGRPEAGQRVDAPALPAAAARHRRQLQLAQGPAQPAGTLRGPQPADPAASTLGLADIEPLQQRHL